MERFDANPIQIDLGAFVKRTALEADFSTLVTKETIVYVDNQPKILYLKPDWDFSTLSSTLQRIEYQMSERTGGLKTTSRVFGYQPRVALRRDFCTATSLAHQDAQANSLLCSFATKVEALYSQFFDVTHAQHLVLAEQKILPEWRIPNSCFTSGIVNKNNPLKYHFDSGNFDHVCSCMLGLKRDVIGGYLSCPELDLGFEIADGSLLIFDGQGILHGVTPIRRLTPKAYRYTVVYYSLKGMWKCEPLDAELARIRTIKMQRELKRAGLIDEAIVDQHGERE